VRIPWHYVPDLNTRPGGTLAGVRVQARDDFLGKGSANLGHEGSGTLSKGEYSHKGGQDFCVPVNHRRRYQPWAYSWSGKTDAGRCQHPEGKPVYY